MSRCSISMPSNISEGSAKTDKSFSNYLDISLGSSFELGTQLIIAKHKKYLTQNQLEKFDPRIFPKAAGTRSNASTCGITVRPTVTPAIASDTAFSLIIEFKIHGYFWLH